MNEEVGVGYADIDLNLMKDIRSRLPSVCHKRNDLYWFFLNFLKFKLRFFTIIINEKFIQFNITIYFFNLNY